MKHLSTVISARAAIVAAALWSGAAAAQPLAPEPPPPLDPWYEALQFGLFADSYASINYNFPKPQQDANGLSGRSGSIRAYDVHSGVSLSWVGLDVAYPPAPVGGALSLRLGPTAELYSASCLSTYTRCDADVPGLGFIKQAYASWRPAGPESSLTVDFGKFDTIYGAEVAESHLNFNYTRGALYWLAQPLFHTGLRASADLWPELGVVALAANGWNNSVDNNLGKTFGLQFALRPAEAFSAYAGWLGGPEQDDSAIVACGPDTAYSPQTGDCFPAPGTPAASYVVDQGLANSFEAWRHLVDLVVLLAPLERLQVMVNADLGFEGVRTNQPDGSVDTDQSLYYGGMLASRYALNETFAVAARGEYFADPDGLQTQIEQLKLVTATLTLEAAPSDFLLLRLEGRGDFALDARGSKQIFKKSVRDGDSQMFTSTLGVVVKTN